MSYLKLKCTEFDFGWGSDPHPAGGAFSAPADPLAEYKVATSKGRERMKDGREGQGRDLLLRGGGKGGKLLAGTGGGWTPLVGYNHELC